MEYKRLSERGSVIFWIFIAIGLFAALSFTVSRIGRSGDATKMDELAQLKGADMMQYAGAVQRGVRVMRVNGVDESELCFHTAQWGHADYEYNPQCTVVSNQVFNSEGGGIGFQGAVADWYANNSAPASDAGTWVFSARYEITNVGTDSGGAATIADNADVLMATAPVRDDVCASINRLLNYSPVTPPAVPAGTYIGLGGAPFKGTFANGAGRIGDLGRERCVSDGTFNVYYKVILAR